MIVLVLITALLGSVTAQAAPIAVDIDKNVNLAIGTRTFGPVNVPNDLAVCALSIDRTNWTNPASTISVSLSISVNNGPFVFWLGMTSKGATFDAQMTETKMTRALPAGTSRRVQGAYVVSGARFVSTVSVACN